MDEYKDGIYMTYAKGLDVLASLIMALFVRYIQNENSRLINSWDLFF